MNFHLLLLYVLFGLGNAEYSITVAGSAIRHLTRIGVIESDLNNDDRSNTSRNHRRYPPQRNEDAPLLLSRLAQDRAYFPEGILDHHHATQFITFSPPFECENYNYNYNYNYDDIMERTTSSNGNGNGNGNDVDSAAHKSHTTTKRDNRDKTKAATTTATATNSSGVRVRRSSSSNAIKANIKNQQDGRRRGCFSRLNCLRNCNSSKTRNSGDDDFNRHISMATLTEEEEKRWLAYSMKPIAEDQSLANASVVSMSAPLLR